MQHWTNMNWINDIPLPSPICMTRPSSFLFGQHQHLSNKADIPFLLFFSFLLDEQE